MIQDIYPLKLDNSFVNRKPLPEDKVLYFKDHALFAYYDKEKLELCFPSLADVSAEVVTDVEEEETKAQNIVYLFSIGEKRFFLLLDQEDEENHIENYIENPSLGPYSFIPMNEVRRIHLSSNQDVFAACTAYHLWHWYRTSRFCGACGGKTVRDQKERAMVCLSCSNIIYPRINPAVIIGVKNGEKLLLTRYRTGYAHNALVAGFTEIGETLEETVKREVMEEVGLKVKNIRYYKSQPWGVAQDILMGFYCDVDGEDAIQMDENELKYAEWVQREEIVLQPSDYSLTNEMMKMFREGKIS